MDSRPYLRSRRAPALASLSALVLTLAGCSGDDGRDDAGESSATSTATATDTTTASATATESASGASDSESSASGASDSASTGTTGATASESESNSASASASVTDSNSGGTATDTDSDTTTTGGGSGFCGDDPPAGYFGDFNAECANEPNIGTFNPVIEWHKSTFEMLAGGASASAPIVCQLSDDNMDGVIDEEDMPDVVYISYNGNNGILRGISGDGMSEHFNVGSVGLDRNKAIACADIDGDGVVEILSSTTSREIIAFENDGTVKWKSAAITAHVGVYEVAPAISDMNGDGTPEIIVGRAILDNAGNLLGAGTHGIGAAPHQNGSASMSFAVDLDDDGEQEVVVGNAVYNIAGGDIWFNGEADGYPAIGDFDLDGQPEIVVVSNGTLRLQASDTGEVIWAIAIPGGIGGPPTVADFDGDGEPEIGVAGKSRYSVFEGGGTVLWTNTTQDASSGITGSSVYDFEGDGVADVVYADEINLYVYAGNDGTTKLKLTEHNSGTRLEYPVIADVDNDDQVEIVFVSEPYNGNYAGVTVVGDGDLSWRPGRKLWNQHAYHITNVNRMS
ncbi:MAG: FG-GAP-like repeat-containing protein [Nannocystaceae bacterium]